MEEEEDRLLFDRTAAQASAERNLRAAILVGGLLGLLGGIGAALFFHTKIARRIGRLQQDARAVAEGRPILSEIEGNDEIAQLGNTLKETSQLLARQGAELRAAHDL